MDTEDLKPGMWVEHIDLGVIQIHGPARAGRWVSNRGQVSPEWCSPVAAPDSFQLTFTISVKAPSLADAYIHVGRALKVVGLDWESTYEAYGPDGEPIPEAIVSAVIAAALPTVFGDDDDHTDSKINSVADLDQDVNMDPRNR